MPALPLKLDTSNLLLTKASLLSSSNTNWDYSEVVWSLCVDLHAPLRPITSMFNLAVPFMYGVWIMHRGLNLGRSFSGQHSVSNQTSCFDHPFWSLNEQVLYLPNRFRKGQIDCKTGFTTWLNCLDDNTDHCLTVNRLVTECSGPTCVFIVTCLCFFLF